ncbi:thiamine pyrophosphate-binding protein [Thermaerobacter sp. PB12/4term]|uniref:thiamine pyrophosphate-binding protein n=1 Tax=Thermaerobacter sp. PB12/4term TaxID=2293838 RepID=UPI000E32C330|nr:thiamine pyrophosphate-binding protein [Thermaerobacter sp. PB12/4term]QIA26273.1 thiamine pyrophosphate-binding protein [Thermaerobacter sp. PB12/4term]
MDRFWEQGLISRLRPYEPALVVTAGEPLPAPLAAAAADGAARATGRPAVLVAGSGAELNGMLPALAVADADSVPLVVLVRGGTAADLEAGRERAGALPDTLRLTEPVTGWNTRVDRPEDLDLVLEAAFTDLARRRPRPLLIELAVEALPRLTAVPPSGTASGPAAARRWAGAPGPAVGEEPTGDPAAGLAGGLLAGLSGPGDGGGDPAGGRAGQTGADGAYGDPAGPGGRRDGTAGPETFVDRRWIDQVAAALVRGRQPAIIAGGGAAGAAESLRRLAETLGAPVFLTLAGRGLLPAEHPLAVEGLGAAPARRWLEEADVLLVVGTTLSPAEHGDLQLKGRVVHIDRDAERLGRNTPVWLALPGDAAPVLAALARRVEAEQARPGGPEVYLGATGPEQRRREVARLKDDLAAAPQMVPEAIAAWFAGLEPRLTAAEPGALSVVEANLLPVPGPRSLLVPVRLGQPGYAIPAAWGAVRATGRPARAITSPAGLLAAAAVLPWIASLGAGLEILVRLDAGDEGEEPGVPLDGRPGLPGGVTGLPGAGGGQGLGSAVAAFFRRAAGAFRLEWDEPGPRGAVPFARLRPAEPAGQGAGGF